MCKELGDLLTMVTNYLLTGMILQAGNDHEIILAVGTNLSRWWLSGFPIKTVGYAELTWRVYYTRQNKIWANC